ncbi:WD40/YVTN/BNR-like repeat-containing protein [Curvibacter gracilis]|uniref:WD40/YVTN/BNR-like repeat-containing protein n=1 Tax=Curvibacter gracilis TaxID=230310 RepID=UPI000688BC19|nr:YCF48-related protein [Curvibacter gracilis]
MKKSTALHLPSRLLPLVQITVLAACLASPGVQAQESNNAPRLVPAVRVAHAGTASLLGATRAGDRLVAVGDHGVVMLSDDGGQTWRQAKSVPVDSTLTSVSFTDARQGWAAGHWGVILHTEDGGESWAVQRSATGEDRPLFALHMLDAQRGVAVGLWSLVLSTDDGGKSWNPVTLAPPEGARKADLNLLSLFATGQGVLYATAEKGMLLRSTDQGRHWSYLSTGYKGSFWTGVALPGGELLAAGLRGSLYRSTDEGKRWSRIDSHSESSITQLVAVQGNGVAQVVGVGLDGLRLQSQDAGARFKTEVRPDHLGLTAAVVNAQGRLVLLSKQGLVQDAAKP